MNQFHPIRIIQMLWLSLRCRAWIPFKIYSRSYIKIKSGAIIESDGRLTLGTQKNQAVISVQPTNIFIGKNGKLISGKSVSIGPGVNLIVKENALLSIGENSYFTSDNHIESIQSITIGKDCAISWGVTIIDSDHHQILSDKYEKKDSGVTIGDHVWVGCNVTILRNTVIGNNCVVAAGSIVKGNFPDNCIIGGNPAKILLENTNWK